MARYADMTRALICGCIALLLAGCQSEAVDNAKVGAMKFDKSMQRWMASVQAGNRGLEWGEMPEEIEAEQEPDAYCYSTLGAVDCYDTPQENAKSRLVGNIPRKASKTARSKYDESPAEILAKGIKPGSPQPAAVESSPAAQEAVVEQMPDNIPGRGRPGYLLRQSGQNTTLPTRPATPGMMVFAPNKAAGNPNATNAAAPKPLVSIPENSESGWVETAEDTDAAPTPAPASSTPPVASAAPSSPPLSGSSGKLLKSTSHEITYDSGGKKLSE